MTDTYTALDWIFNLLQNVFTFMMTSWILAIVVLCGLLSMVVTLYLNTRQK